MQGRGGGGIINDGILLYVSVKVCNVKYHCRILEKRPRNANELIWLICLYIVRTKGLVLVDKWQNRQKKYCLLLATKHLLEKKITIIAIPRVLCDSNTTPKSSKKPS